MSDTFTVEFTKEELFIAMIAVSLFRPASKEGPRVKAELLGKLDAEWKAGPEALDAWRSDVGQRLKAVEQHQPYRPFSFMTRVNADCQYEVTPCHDPECTICRGPMNPPEPHDCMCGHADLPYCVCPADGSPEFKERLRMADRVGEGIDTT